MFVCHSHVVACHSSFYYCWTGHCMNRPQFICFFLLTFRLGCCQYLAIVCGVTTNVLARVFGAFTFLLGIFLEVEVLGYRVYSALDDTDKLLSKVVSPIYIPTEVSENPNCSTSLSTLGIFSVFHFSHFDWYVVAFYSFNLTFDND